MGNRQLSHSCYVSKIVRVFLLSCEPASAWDFWDPGQGWRVLDAGGLVSHLHTWNSYAHGYISIPVPQPCSESNRFQQPSGPVSPLRCGLRVRACHSLGITHIWKKMDTSRLRYSLSSTIQRLLEQHLHRLRNGGTSREDLKCLGEVLFNQSWQYFQKGYGK